MLWMIRPWFGMGKREIFKRSAKREIKIHFGNECVKMIGNG